MKIILALLLALAPLAASAQGYPAKPVKILVPAQPGGGLDLIGRTGADQLSRALDQSFVVENSGGGGGSVACRGPARGPPGGYKLFGGVAGPAGTHSARRKVHFAGSKGITP